MSARDAGRTTKMSSKWGEVGPVLGSGYVCRRVSLLGTRSQPIWRKPVSEIGPVWSFFHCAISAGSAAGTSHALNVSVAFVTGNVFGSRTWSDMFFPTDGRFTSVLIPTADRSAGLPIPLSMRSCGVLNEPAERTTSLRAVTLMRGAAESIRRWPGWSLTARAHRRRWPRTRRRGRRGHRPPSPSAGPG
jgi:hypothetical protein